MNPVDHVRTAFLLPLSIADFWYSPTVVVTINISVKPRQFLVTLLKVKKLVLSLRGGLGCYVVHRRRRIRGTQRKLAWFDAEFSPLIFGHACAVDCDQLHRETPVQQMTPPTTFCPFSIAIRIVHMIAINLNLPVDFPHVAYPSRWLKRSTLSWAGSLLYLDSRCCSLQRPIEA
jgi:hypothetical protein